MDISTYVNKTVDFKFMGAELRFDLSHALFSSFDIDQGTRLLLKAVARDPVLARSRRILDEGCGVGVIGLSIAKAFPEAELVLRDRDSLAVAFAESNRVLNKLRGTTAWTDPTTGESRIARPAPRAEWGLLADGLEGGPFDFVLSNLPAKAGAPVLAAFFAQLPALLVPGGRAGVVIVNPLAEAAASWIAKAGLTLLSEEKGSGHRVFIVARDNEDARDDSALHVGENASESEVAAQTTPALGPYLRSESRFKLADQSFRARGFWGLPEFDTPGFGSSVAAETAAKAFAGASRGSGRESSALFINPGIGLPALWASRALGIKSLTAVSRDALVLEATASNLASLSAASRPAYSAVDALKAPDLPPSSFDLIVESPDIVPERDWIGPSWELAQRLLRSGGVYLVHCSPTESTRFEKRKPAGGGRWSLVARRRKKGSVAMAWRRL
jgi:SAM-dependent methyltransferase